MRNWAILLFLACLSAACSRPRTPLLQEVAGFDTSGWAHDVITDGQRLLVADRQGGYMLFDRSRGWDAPVVHAPVSDVISLAPSDTGQVLAARFEGLVLVDMDGRATSRLSLGEIANAVAVRDGLAFAAYGSHGLVITRVQPCQLELVAEFPSPGWAHDVKLRGHFAFLASWNYGLQIVDIGDPRRPVETGHVPTSATAISVAFGEPDTGLVAVAEGHGGVSVVQVDEAGHATRVGHHGLGLDPNAPPHPATGGWAHGVAWAGRCVFVANWKEGLLVIDVTDPRHPEPILRRKTSGTALGVKAERQADGSTLVFLADGEAGLRVFRFTY